MVKKCDHVKTLMKIMTTYKMYCIKILYIRYLISGHIISLSFIYNINIHSSKLNLK